MGITNTGMAEAAALLGTDTTSGHTAFDYIGVGTSSTAFAASQTNLVTPVERITATGTLYTTSQTNDTLQLVATHTAGGTETITEAGVFNAASSGIMLSRLVFTGRVLDTGETLTVTYRIQIKQGA